MKKNSRNIFFFIILFVIFLGLAPRFLILHKVQRTITEQISKNLGSEVAINKMHWAWLPLPHLTLSNTKITNAKYDLALAKVKIYPDWHIIFGEIRKPAKIVLDRPEIFIRKTAFLAGEASEFNLPELIVIIKNGNLEVESPQEYKDFLLADTQTFSSISGELRLQSQKVEVDIRASSPFSEKISLQGNFYLHDKIYRFNLDCRNITLHNTVKGFFRDRLIPVTSSPRLTVAVNGRSREYIEGELHGALPSFLLKLKNHEIPLTPGNARLKFSKSGPLLRLEINNLEVLDPEASLAGYIERKLSRPESEEKSMDSEPVWSLDITGRDLDLTAIRQKVMTLWPDNSTAKTVSHIVIGGRARSAAYRFSGTTEDFNDLAAITIEADALSADIHIPKTKLDLTDASGPILIKDATLTGHGLSARFENSFGRNGDLLLDLEGHDKSFNLDVDIDADLADLPQILTHLVNHNDVFQRELSKFSTVSGKATGTLHLGDTLDHIITRVSVNSMEFTTRYEPIPQPVSVASGVLRIGPDKVVWEKIKGSIGRQQISNTTGIATWPAGEIMLHIEEMQARLEGASLFTMLQQTGNMKQEIGRVLSSLNGTVTVNRGTLQGPALKPEAWSYDIMFATKGMAFTSPLLPEQARIEKLTAEINSQEANIQEGAFRFLEQGFNLKGRLQHHLLEDWHGFIIYDGPVQAKLAEWISSKGWFPEKLQPQIPCTMENLKVQWQGATIAVSGIILHGSAGGRLPMAKIDFVNSPEHLRINELTFYAPEKRGSLKLDFWRFSPLRLVVSWEGYVNAATIDTLFHHSSFSSGTFTGAFTISYFADKPEATRFNGLLKAGDLYLKTRSSEDPILLKNLDIKGMGRQLRIPNLELHIGSEIVTGSGQLAAERDGLQLDISLASSFLTKKSLTRLSQAGQETFQVFSSSDSDASPGQQLARGWDITGRIGFDFDSFKLSRKITTPYDAAPTVHYTFYDVHGDLQLAANKVSKTEIFSSKLCGLDFKGVWYSDENLGQKIQLKTPHETMRLENVLPCLGVQQDIIEGEFSLQADLLKEADTWYGGNIYIKSSQGRILRLKTLSRIFAVVNITDLFEKNVGNAGKRGFPFSKMDIDSHIKANNLIIDRAIIRGEGLDLFAEGQIHLDDYDADLTLLIAPLKTFGNIVSRVPMIGQSVVGESGSRVSIPVAIRGPIADPAITPMHPGAIGDALLDLVKDTFMLPLNIFKPSNKSDNRNKREQVEEK